MACQCFQYNNTGAFLDKKITYFDCNGNTQSILNIEFGQSGYFCSTWIIYAATGIEIQVVDNSNCGECSGGVTSTPTPTQTATPSHTPTQTNTPTVTKTPTNTPTFTSTPRRTPSPTPTQTQTPSRQAFICGSGLTQNSYFYTDCCGNFVQGVGAGQTIQLNYTLPFQGITLLNVPASPICLTPTPSPTATSTPSVTPTTTLTLTPTNTPNTTPTPTPTPTRNPVTELKNNCDVFTLFDMGVSCDVLRQPSNSESFDGIVTLRVTGGTAPYSFFWTNGQRTQTLTNIASGLYPVTVIDYYGDYTANTVCSVLAPTPTASPTPTLTPSRSPDPIYPNICFLAYNNQNVFGQTTFIQNGTFNSRPRWTSSNSENIVWKGTRWELVGSDLTTPVSPVGGGLFGSVSTQLPPLGGWELFGGTQAYTINVTQGTCPEQIPLQVNIESQNTSCNQNTNCDGSITIQARFGLAPYEYSINNGVTWQNSPIFTSLCQGTYNVRVRDASNTTFSETVQINSVGTPTTYQINVVTQPQFTSETNAGGTASKTTYFIVNTQPPLPPGITVGFNLTTSSTKIFNGPGTGTIIDNITIKQNNNNVTPFNVDSSTLNQSRPNCNPESQQVITETDQYYLELTSTGTISGSTTSVLTITDGQVGQQSNCTTNLEQEIYIQISEPVIKGCTCCTAVADNLQTEINSNSISFNGIIEVPECVVCQGQIQSGTIYLDMNNVVGGSICTSPNGIGCFQNFRYNATGGILSDNFGLSSYPCGISSNSNVQYIQANFQTPTSDNYYVEVFAFLNGIEVGSGIFNGFCTSNVVQNVNVNMYSPININAGDTFTIRYESESAGNGRRLE